jgi:LysR family carnitine catabolism transcriptional activator
MNGFNPFQVSPKQIRGFIAVAGSLSFAQASEELHISQPALSIAIKNLEAALGGQLFTRSTRSLTLTPEGLVFLPVAKRLMASWEQGLVDVFNQFSLKQGRLEIAVMPSYAATQLAQVITPFKQAYPDINLTVHDVVAEDVVTMVREGRVELGISFDPGKHDDLTFVPLFKDRFVALISPESALLKHKTLSWRHLEKEPFISLQAPSSMRDLIETKIGRSLNVAIESHQLVTIGQLAAAGLGVSIVPSLCQQMMEQQGAVCKPFNQPVISRSVGVITKNRRALSASANALMTSIVES